MAVLGAAFGLLAMFYLVFAWSLTLKNFGLSVEAQLIAQRIITPLLFVALGALAVSCEYFRRVRLQTGTKSGVLVRILRLGAVVVLPVVIVIFTLQTPFWSFNSPDGWDRPRFDYGWPLPWKGEKMGGAHMICPFLNLFLWTLYLMVLVGYRRIKHYLVLLVVMLVLFVPYAKFVGIKPVHRGRRPQSKLHPPTAAMSPATAGMIAKGETKPPALSWTSQRKCNDMRHERQGRMNAVENQIVVYQPNETVRLVGQRSVFVLSHPLQFCGNFAGNLRNYFLCFFA
jgi:hypothetical protein